MSELILLCRPEELREARRFGLRRACAGWKIGEDGRLYRCAMPAGETELMAVFGAGNNFEGALAEDIRRECSRLGGREVLCFSPSDIMPRCRGCKITAPRSTALWGGELRELFRDKSPAFIEPVREYFSLPFKNGGSPISEERLCEFRAKALAEGFSRELGCKYLLSAEGCVLYDDAESIARKIDILSDMGVEKAVLPYGSGRIREFLRLYR